MSQKATFTVKSGLAQMLKGGVIMDVTNAAQAAVSNLPGNDLATGINALAEVASVLHLSLLDDVKKCLEPQLGYAVELIYQNIDADEVYQVLDGKAQAVLQLADAEKLRDLPMNVEITLTRAKRQEEREGASQFIAIAAGYFNLPPAAKLRLRPAFTQLASGWGFKDPERFFPTDDEVAQEFAALLAQQQAEQAAAMGGAGDQPAPEEAAPVEGEAGQIEAGVMA